MSLMVNGVGVQYTIDGTSFSVLVGFNCWHKRAASFVTMQRMIRYFQFCRGRIYMYFFHSSSFLYCNKPWIADADRSSAL